MATASSFKSMMSINPAVIHERPAATFSLKARYDQVEKEQEVSEETPPKEIGGQKYKTHTTIMGAEVNYSYSF